jgi:quinol monooxygenase YgiN
MNAKKSLVFVAAVLCLGVYGPAFSQSPQAPYVRLAELEIDPAQLENFKSAVTEGIEAAVRLEPGVTALYAVYEKDHPASVRVFEVYTDEKAYQSHLETPHFKKFRATTDKMVTSRKLLNAVPIALRAKPAGAAAGSK